MISSCANALRELNKKFHNAFGDRQGTRHSSSNLTRDIKALVDSLRKHRVYIHTPGRQFDKRDEAPLDSVTEGYKILIHAPSTSLSDLQAKFLSLQRRSHVPPLELCVTSDIGATLPTLLSAHSSTDNRLHSPELAPTAVGRSTVENSPSLDQRDPAHEQPEQDQVEVGIERGEYIPGNEEEGVDDDSGVRVGLYDIEDVAIEEEGSGRMYDDDTEEVYDKDESSSGEESNDIPVDASDDGWQFDS
ncbi:hypothetical protein RSOL_094020, partial [Rhizoctonia solani AG-3 Rhs1AP]